MHHTTNETTCTVGAATATVIADTVSSCTDLRITTLELVYPRIIHSELMTHRAFSRNAASSRATPVRCMLREVSDAPYVPTTWLENKAGMAGGAPLDDGRAAQATEAVARLRHAALDCVTTLLDLNVSKQQANRYLESFAPIRTLVTATEWENFFNLRLDREHVQPEMYDLAVAASRALSSSMPMWGTHHVPYIGRGTRGGYESQEDMAHEMLLSAARCARVSYLSHDEKTPDVEKDLALAKHLWKNRHLSPFEHAAIAAKHPIPYANFTGWRSFRFELETSPTVAEMLK